MSDEVKIMEEIRALFGLALYNSQLLEKQLIRMIFAANLQGKLIQSNTDLKERFEHCFNHTLALLLNDMKLTYAFDGHLVNHIHHSLDLRNRFSYKYLSKQTKELFSTEGRMTILKELEEASLYYTQTNHLLRECLDHYLADHGMDHHQLEQTIAATFKS